MAHGVNSECALAASTPNRRRYLEFLDLEKARKNRERWDMHGWYGSRWSAIGRNNERR